jgi:hypothetical protein
LVAFFLAAAFTAIRNYPHAIVTDHKTRGAMLNVSAPD